jgi:plasmid rolling circle replication initiator protein Rep
MLNRDLTESRANSISDCNIIILDKLAQLQHKTAENFKKRAKAKYITMSFINYMCSIDSSLTKSYKNTSYCVKQLNYDQEKKTLTGKYCGNRWCLVCNRIRTGKLMNQYYDFFVNISTAHFLTLTIPNCSGDMLPNEIDSMLKTFRTIVTKLARNKLKQPGLRKIECTYNQKLENFHPHLHIITSTRLQADEILKLWKLHFCNISMLAQDIRPADPGTLKELFKYFTKIVTRSKKTDKNTYIINCKALNIINQSMYMRRVFQTFGGLKAISEEVEELQSDYFETVKNADVWTWIQDQSDWISDDGEALTENTYNKTIKVSTI